MQCVPLPLSSTYVGNRPINSIDPLGLCVWDLCVGESLLVDAAGTAMVIYFAGQAYEQAQKKAEYDAYKKRCNESPPPGLDPCALAQWKLQRNKDCKEMREQFSKKWYNDNECGHAQAVQELETAIKKLEDWIAKNCTCKK